VSDVEQSEFYETAPTYCVHLSEARNQQQLTLEQVSEKLKVPVSYLQALEQGAVDQLPNVAFARGYLRSYARLLGLDADQLIAEFNEVCTAQEPAGASIERIPNQEHARSLYPKLIVWLFALIVAGSSFWWWQYQTGADEQPSSVPSAAVPAQVSEQSPAADQSVVTTPESESPAGEVAETDLAQPAAEDEPVYLSAEEIERLAHQLDTAEDSAEPAAAETEISADSVAGSSLLRLSFTAECWLSIETLDGAVIFADLMQSGEILERELNALPVKLLVGQVGAVDLAQFKGRELSLADHARQGVARLTLE
jgi:cytoskeleton protein RodZ